MSTSGATRALISDWLRFFAEHGVRIVRLDAVGYVIKKPGTTCFMVEPEIYDFLGWITERRGDRSDSSSCPRSTTATRPTSGWRRHGFWTYDFVLPGCVLHALETGEAHRLAEHLARSPTDQFTMLDCHDGIPVRPDLDGILEPGEMLGLADARPSERGGNVNRILSDVARRRSRRPPAELHLLLGARGDDERYVAARAIQLFARGVPQIYYVGLLAGENDHGRSTTGDGRAINRHDYTVGEIDVALQRPVVRRLLDSCGCATPTRPSTASSASSPTGKFHPHAMAASRCAPCARGRDRPRPQRADTSWARQGVDRRGGVTPEMRELRMDQRVSFDFEIEFTNGGALQGQDFRLDVPGRTSPTCGSPMRSCATCGC